MVPDPPKRTQQGHANTDLEMKPFQPEDVHHIVFSSGSTGTPKGIVFLERAVYNRLNKIRWSVLRNSSRVCILLRPLSGTRPYTRWRTRSSRSRIANGRTICGYLGHSSLSLSFSSHDLNQYPHVHIPLALTHSMQNWRTHRPVRGALLQSSIALHSCAVLKSLRQDRDFATHFFEDMMLLRPTNVTSTPRFWEILYNQFQAAFKEAKAANPVSPASKLPC